jgi:hypothetical protein
MPKTLERDCIVMTKSIPLTRWIEYIYIAGNDFVGLFGAAGPLYAPRRHSVSPHVSVSVGGQGNR